MIMKKWKYALNADIRQRTTRGCIAINPNTAGPDKAIISSITVEGTCGFVAQDIGDDPIKVSRKGDKWRRPYLPPEAADTIGALLRVGILLVRNTHLPHGNGRLPMPFSGNK